MKRTILLVALVLACVGVAGAQTIDPTIILNGPGDFLTVSSLTFSGAFTASGTPTGNICPAGIAKCFDGQNQTGFHWIALSITYTLTLANSTPLMISCLSNLFDINNCASGVPVTITTPPTLTVPDPTGTVTLTFACSGAALASTAGCGIFNFTALVDPVNSFVNYVDPTSAGAADILNTTFTATATPTPEPGTIALLLAGIGAVVARRRVGKNYKARS